ncbi:MAG: MFS transporter, partial [Actinomycetota bacterium]|nr:MFS transporter [Actinomycetota bacterium]
MRDRHESDLSARSAALIAPGPTAPPDPLAAALRLPWHRSRPPAWEHPGFRRLTSAWVFTNIADSALYLMVAVWVKELTGSDGAAALVFVMLGLPALAAPFLGQVADRLSRRRLLVVANACTAVVVTSLFLVDSAAWLWLVYAVILVYGAVGYLTAAAQSGLVRDLLPDQHLASGNGVLSTIDQALRLVSPLVGTALYVLVGPQAVVGLTGVCFLAAALLLSRVRVVESEPEDAATRGSYRTELFAGFRHIARTPVLGRLTLLLPIGFGATGLANVAVFPVMAWAWHPPPWACWSACRASARSSPAPPLRAPSAGWARPAPSGSGWPCSAWGCCRCSAAAWSSCSSAWPRSAGVSRGFIVAFVTLRQRLTPPRLQGRTSAAANVAVNLPQTVMTLLGAAAVLLVDYRLLVAVTAA